jgi:CubicO group peptidase (beta-lactamase class C family)
MYLLREQILRILLLVVLFLAIIFSGCKYRNAAASEISIEGAVYHVHRPDGSHKTYFDVVVGLSFSGILPDDVDLITVTGPNGDLSIGKDDFNYNPQWRDFWIALPGFPEIGTYSFKLASGNSFGFSTDTQSIVKTIPIPDVSKFKPAKAETDSCLTPTFSWSSINKPNALYYQLQIRDLNRKHVYRTDYVRDMLSVRIPPDVLKPGMTYQWRVRVADGPNWITLNNRSQSQWVTFSRNQVIKSCSYQYGVPKKADDDWEISSLNDEGIDPGKINELMHNILNGNIQDIHSVLIIKNGKLVLEDYFHGSARNKTHRMMSVSKSITSILIGIAQDQKKIPNIDKKISEFFPSYKEINWDNLKNEIRLKHVLTMTAGLDWNAWNYPDSDMRDSTNAMTRSDDWIKFVLEKKAINTPGKNFVYNNGLTMLLGEILRNTTGLYADKFAEEYLFGPLGISDFSWQKLPDGTIITAWGLKLKPRDMAKIGYMMLKDGKWNGKQIVSPTWVKESTKAHIEGDILLGSGYGYQWWRGRTFIANKDIETFYAAGKGGQFIFVCPALDLVTVFTSKTGNDSMGEFRPQIIMVKYIIPAMLSPSPPRKTIKLDSKIVEKYVGNYEFQKLNIPLTIFREGDILFFKSPDEEKGELFPETETQFFGASKEIGDFQVNFFKDKKGEIKHFVVQVGFGIWQFDKIKK